MNLEPLPPIAPRSAYVHVPFCRHRCGYCNFTLIAGRDDLIESYLQAVELELRELPQGHRLDTLFLGGGTPSHLTCPQLERLFGLLDATFVRSDTCETSIEINPCDLDVEKAALLRDLRANRASLGVQSLSAKKLRILERDHRRPDVERAVETAHRYFESVSIDLIFAAPNETLADWREDVRQTIAMQPQHVSTYGLTYDRGAAFWGRRHRGELKDVPEDVETEMFSAGIAMLAEAGFEHYEVSNFAMPGHRSIHNENYWLGGPFFAVGPGATRFVDGRRETNHRSTTGYIRRLLAGLSPIAESEKLAPSHAARERLIFAMRRLEGVERSWFQRQTNYTVDELVGEAISRFVEQGFMIDDGTPLAIDTSGADGQ